MTVINREFISANTCRPTWTSFWQITTSVWRRSSSTWLSYLLPKSLFAFSNLSNSVLNSASIESHSCSFSTPSILRNARRKSASKCILPSSLSFSPSNRPVISFSIFWTSMVSDSLIAGLDCNEINFCFASSSRFCKS